MKLFIILLSTIIFLLVMINVFVSLVIYLGEDYHVIDQIKIYEVFQEKIYRKVREDMMRQNYTILIGDDESGVKNFIEHQANLRTLEGMAVVIKRYQSISQSKKQIFNKVKQTRYYLEFALGFERRERTEVFFVDKLYQIPYEEVNFIKTRYPQDNIIIICPKNLKIEMQGFIKINFPPVSQKMLKVIISRYYHIKPQSIDSIFERYDHNIERVFDYFKKVAKKEDIGVQELIQIDQIEDLNELSHELAVKQEKKLLKKMEKYNKPAKNKKTKKSKSQTKKKSK